MRKTGYQEKNEYQTTPTSGWGRRNVYWQVVTISSVSLSADIPVEQSISYNEALQKIIRIANDQMQKYDELLQENIRLREENNELILQKQQASPEVLAQEDLDAFLQIMKRSKCLTHV
ncbi:hypothetical protein LJR153_002231 [Paenibacillus sp. LjRoot153]|uniref:hypothetical protein n=1 Tax=Paenibacillus sp. LjRoot153 TaxID=3342270 RepID=UPI003ECDE3BD